MNPDTGMLYDLSNDEQRAMFESDGRAVKASDQVAADQMRGRLARLEEEIARDSSLKAHFDRQDSQR